MSSAQAVAWFAGRRATDLVEVRHDLDGLDGAGWWALVVDFEGEVTAGRFARVEDAAVPLPARPWAPLRAGWRSSLDRPAYEAAVREVRRRVAAGELYQANVCRVLEHDLAEDADLLALAALTVAGNPAPYAGVVRLPGADVVCASPELFLRRDGEGVATGPVKGTAATADGLREKDTDENVMIVDLARNDLSLVCRPGTVAVDGLLSVEQHPGLVHLVSRVSGRLRPDVRWAELLAATLPPASVTGAPKSTALQAIRDLEPVPRGPYCGAVGWVDADAGTAELAVGIRTFWSARDAAGRRVLRFGAGAGITWGSDPAGEWAETGLKAARLVGLASGRVAP
jgi:para-aminobenzoate synthetase component 1